MERTFRADKMLQRLEKEGRMSEVIVEDRAFMQFLDGRKGNDYNWESFVNDNPLVWIDGTDEEFNCEKFEGTYVALCDCE